MLLRVFLRSLFLQASWNPKGMQNLGLVYALYPALEVLYPDPEARGEAVQRHLTFFNTHPYVAAAIVGGVLYHEERIAGRRGGPLAGQRVQARPDGSPGGAGRRLLLALAQARRGRPLRRAGALAGGLGRGALPGPLQRRALHLPGPALPGWGSGLGDRLVEAVARAHLPSRGARLRAVAAASAGAAATYLAFAFGSQQGGVGGWLLAGGCLALGALSYVLVARRVPTAALTILAAVLAGCLGAWL